MAQSIFQNLRSLTFPDSVFDHARFQPEVNQTQYSLVGNPVFQKAHHPPLIDFIEERADVGIQNPVHLPLRIADVNASSASCCRVPAGILGESEKTFFIDCTQHRNCGLL